MKVTVTVRQPDRALPFGRIVNRIRDTVAVRRHRPSAASRELAEELAGRRRPASAPPIPRPAATRSNAPSAASSARTTRAERECGQ